MSKAEAIANKSHEFITPATWISRACPICGESSNLVRIGERTYHVPTRAGNYLLHHEDVQCPCCGLVFTASVPEEEFLSIYYANAHTQRSDIIDIPPVYNTQTRLTRLRQHIALGSEILEIGANDGQFLQALNKVGYNATGLDPLIDCERKPMAGLISGKDLNRFVATRKFDAVLSYYVLEHVSNPRQWLSDWRRFLRLGGHAIIEVPNFEQYPAESLYKEHFQHFTKKHLETLLRSCGFEELTIFEEGSYYFGMTAVARLAQRNYAETSLACYKTGTTDVAIISGKVRQAALVALEKVSKEGRIVVWGASQFGIEAARRLFEEGYADFLCVDNAASKIGQIVRPFLGEVRSPNSLDCRRKHIFILCAGAGNPSVLEQIKQMSFASGHVLSCDLEVSEELPASA